MNKTEEFSLQNPASSVIRCPVTLTAPPRPRTPARAILEESEKIYETLTWNVTHSVKVYLCFGENHKKLKPVEPLSALLTTRLSVEPLVELGVRIAHLRVKERVGVVYAAEGPPKALAAGHMQART